MAGKAAACVTIGQGPLLLTKDAVWDDLPSVRAGAVWDDLPSGVKKPPCTLCSLSLGKCTVNKQGPTTQKKSGE